MRGRLSDKERLGFIILSIRELEEALLRIDYETFANDFLIRHGVTKIVENICESTILISPEIKLKYPEVAWRDMKTMRNYLTHEYFGINFHQVWKVSNDDIPILKEQILKILAESFGE